MLMNNLDPEVAEHPDELVVYGGTGKAARNWDAFARDRSRAAGPRGRRDAARPVRQARRRVRTHEWAPRVLIANSNLVPAVGHLGGVPPARAARPDDVRPDDRRLLDLHRHPGHPAGHLRDVRRRRRASTSAARSPGTLIADRGPGRHGRRAAAGRHHERRRRAVRRGRPAARIERRLETGYLDELADDLDDALGAGRRQRRATAGRSPSACVGNAAEVLPGARAPRRRDRHRHRPDLAPTTRSTATCPAGMTVEQAAALRRSDPDEYLRPRARESMVAHVRARWSRCSDAGAEAFDYGNNLRGQA